MTDYVAYAQQNMLNPFDPPADPERHHLWQRLVMADCEAFLAGDWSSIDNDFDAEHFEGIHCFGSTDPDKWRVTFPTLQDYRQSWQEASLQFLTRRFSGLTHRQALFARTHLTHIEITGNRALCQKQFFGELPLADGSLLTGGRQTLYRLHRKGRVWLIVGFLGQLPLFGKSSDSKEGRSP